MLFLSLEELPNCKAPGILAALDNAFAKFGILNWKQKLIGFCSDGAVRGVSALINLPGSFQCGVLCISWDLL